MRREVAIGARLDSFSCRAGSPGGCLPCRFARSSPIWTAIPTPPGSRSRTRAPGPLPAARRAWLRPGAARFSPSRGAAYEPHLTPPAHLVGLRVAALDSLLDRSPGAEAPVIVISAVALSEKVPDPALRPHGFVLRKGDLLDLEECAQQLVAAGYERVDQVEDRGQFAVRGGLLDVYPATEDRAIRIDLFDIEIDSLRWFSTFTQRS